ncbi:hypothetical protein BDM02DRAFT_3192357 [Thelephora ganbajun]|uniref:Uncharacterized protein n=1 Tax=Thelephora ganbajun TaxID=370292 RepID=A0ACB6Z0C9_THEGA|nr:hypothetical protein BDM02DRAFT_3192357 [Thelephora ganbajun]
MAEAGDASDAEVEAKDASDAEAEVTHEEVRDPVAEAKAFLARHSVAKIVIIIDTHCLENGAFVWTGDSPENYQACTLQEILKDCIPPEIFRYLSANDTPKHNHRSIVLNLACGASVSQESSHHSLLEGHCADAVLSLANDNTMVSKVASTMAEFTT